MSPDEKLFGSYTFVFLSLHKVSLLPSVCLVALAENKPQHNQWSFIHLVTPLILSVVPSPVHTICTPKNYLCLWSKYLGWYYDYRLVHLPLFLPDQSLQTHTSYHNLSYSLYNHEISNHHFAWYAPPKPPVWSRVKSATSLGFFCPRQMFHFWIFCLRIFLS